MALRTLVMVAQVIAGDVPPPPPPPPPTLVVEQAPKPKPGDAGPRWSFDLAFAGGAQSINGTTWSQIGVTFGLARRTRGPFSVGIRAEMLTTNRDSDGMTLLGETLRGMAGFELLVYRKRGVFDPQIVVGGGVGREMTAWDGELVDRNLAYLSVGARPSFAIPKSAPYHGISQLGFEVGVRVQIASAHDADDLARSCTQCGPTANAGYDLGIVGYYGLAFGR